MPKNSGQQGNRSIGLDHQCGKGDKNRVTNVVAYRENFDGIDWSSKPAPPTPLETLREIEEAEHDWRMGL